jgi:flagellar biosynthesis/type III secretory pathway M-ring protein FliF/YscJ
MLKYILKYIFRIIMLSIILLVVIWGILLIKNELKTYIHETAEMKYESALTKKATHALNILIPSKQFKIITTVRFRKTIETLSQYTQEPKLINRTKEYSSNTETNSSKAYQLETKSNPLRLPGMKYVISSTKRYTLKEENALNNKGLQNYRSNMSEQQLYFNEQRSNVAYRNNVVSFIRLFVIVDPSVFKTTQRSKNEIRRYLKDSIPFNFTRGDKLVIKIHSVSRSHSFIEAAYQRLKEIKKEIKEIWPRIKPFVMGMLFFGAGVLILYGIYKLSRFFYLKRVANKEREAQKKADEVMKSDQQDAQKTPEYYQKTATRLISEQPKETAKILEGWLRSTHE